MRKFRGSALVDYAIPTLIVGVAVGCGFTYMQSNGLLTNFVAASSNMKVEDGKGIVGTNPISSSTTSTTTTSTSTFTSVATPDNPEINCLAGKCTINFGDFVLTDIEENFASYVASNGSSWGTDKLMAILEQIATQLGDNGTLDADEVAMLQDMANLGHFIARYEQGLEDYINDNGTFNMNEINAVDLPANLSGILTDFGLDCSSGTASSGCSMYDNYSKAMSDTFADVLNMKNSMPAIYEDSTKSDPMFAFYDKYLEVMNSSAYPDSAKKVLQEVMLSLDDITFNFQSQQSVLALGVSTPKTHYDPLTGAVIESGLTYSATDLSALTNPQSSFYTDLDSAIICTAGKDVDTGTECHN